MAQVFAVSVTRKRKDEICFFGCVTSMDVAGGVIFLARVCSCDVAEFFLSFVTHTLIVHYARA